MNKRDFLSLLSSACLKLKLERSNIIIVGDGASLVLGLRTETNDIDVHVDEDTKFDLYWNELVKQEADYLEINHMPRCQHFSFGKISFIYSDMLTNYPTFNHRQYKVLTRLGLLMYRLDLGRQKDLVDIKLLKDDWDKLNSAYDKKLKTFLSKNGIKHAI